MKKCFDIKVVSVLLLLLGAAFLATGCGVAPHAGALSPGDEYTYAEVSSDMAVPGITFSGTVESTGRRYVYTTLGFIVGQVNVEVGDRVVQGQVLGVLNTEDLELTITQQRLAIEATRQGSHVAGAEASVRSAETALSAAQRIYNSARAEYNEGNNMQVLEVEIALRNASIEVGLLETAHGELEQLYDVGAISRYELQQSENALTAAQNQYVDLNVLRDSVVRSQQRSLEQLGISRQAASAELRNARAFESAARTEVSANLEYMEVTLQILERQLEDGIIKAPVCGVVTAVFAREGAVGAGPVFVIEDVDSLRIRARLREYDIGKIAEGMEVSISADATGNAEYVGRVSRINPAAVTNAGAPVQVVEFEVEIDVVSPDTDLRIGMTTRISLM